ncbi:cytochrome bc1 complex Rieske iron-sulfur subunit [Micromonospora sediminimaris]|uniref:Cytochrome bc1 complex Rieske iron-sulfur subunit n=1 Tax=Micromonospora sediminimaris TaxID=547162 RepID=A0A9W5UTT8_9ACTN|nr:Rieske 2Fe-2S domain-containing protein [Micromonospora sediminimaris]GIJ34495.1 ubiquinol-cytochrome c reductase iron-sulfur subunit [Micromonospora sediminimaris]SFD39240.1 ubiquinol-cytochrome c reductase iron-sulfur subunit [Micromonospora sediminimaris]
MNTGTERHDREPTDVNDSGLARFEVVREGARRDDIEIVHYEPQVAAGSKAERRLVRTVTALFLVTGLSATAFLIVYIWWPWRYRLVGDIEEYYTPLLGLTLGVALLALGFGILVWGKRLLPKEVSIQDRHDEPVPAADRRITGQTMLYMADELGVKRRPLLGVSLLAGLIPVGAVVAAPLVGGLIRDPHHNRELFRTGFAPGDDNGAVTRIRLVREDLRPVRPLDLLPGGQVTVFPGIPHGVSNQYADSVTLLIRLRAEDALAARENNSRTGKQDWMWGDFIAYSKICTHAGCPASLYEQQTNRLLCPCHQSQFLITDNARPVFGPASRPLPQLPIEVDDEGFFVASSDYRQPIGPDFWERP